MSLEPGTRLGAYVVEERLGEGASGERWTGSEPGVDRPVLLTITPLPADPAEREATRERLRRRAALEHPSIPPVYGAGEDGNLAWIASRAVAGSTLADTRSLAPGRIARIGGDLRSAVAALAAAGIAPSRVSAQDVVVEGDRTYLVPADQDADADGAPAERDVETLIREIPSTRPRRRLVLIAGAALVAAVVVGVIALVLARGGDNSPTAHGPAATVVARIPVGTPGSGALTVGGGAVWFAGSQDILRIDVATNRVVGSPIRVPVASPTGCSSTTDPSTWRPAARCAESTRTPAAQPGASVFPGAVGLAAEGSTLYVNAVGHGAEPGVLAEVALPSLRVVRRTAHSGPTAFAVDALDGVAWTVNTPQGAVDRMAGGERRSVVAGSEPISAVATLEGLWVTNPRDGIVLRIDPEGQDIVQTLHLGEAPFFPAADEHSVWVLEAGARMALHRIDRATGLPAGNPIPLENPGDRVSPIATGEGAVWVVAGTELLRVVPGADALPHEAAGAPADALASGPVDRVNVRLADRAFTQPLSLVVPSDRWFRLTPGRSDTVALRWAPETVLYGGLSIDSPTQVFDGRGGLRPVRTAAQFLSAIRRHPGLKVVAERPAGSEASPPPGSTFGRHPGPPTRTSASPPAASSIPSRTSRTTTRPGTPNASGCSSAGAGSWSCRAPRRERIFRAPSTASPSRSSTRSGSRTGDPHPRHPARRVRRRGAPRRERLR